MLNHDPHTLPYSIGQHVHAWGGEKSYPISGMGFGPRLGWFVFLNANGAIIPVGVDHVTPENPKQYNTTKVYSTRNGNALGVINGGLS